MTVAAPPSSGKKKPGAAWYLLAVLLLFLGPVSGISLVVYNVFTVVKNSIELMVPGMDTVTINQPGTYIFWSDKTEKITSQNTQVKVHSLGSQQLIEVKSLSGWHEHIDGKERESFAEIVFKEPGQYRIQVSGDSIKQPLLLRHSIFGKIISAIILGALLFFIGIIAGVSIALITFIKRSNYESRSCRLEQSGLPSRQESPASQTYPVSTDDAPGRIWAMLCHLSALTGYFIPFGNIIVPLIIWLLLRRDYPFVDEQGKESLNFQLSIIIYGIIAFLMIIIVIGFFFLALIWLFALIAIIVASVETAQEKHFRYPLSIRFFK